ncbi:MAG: DUF5117 domain-containing protein [Duncaniella sp.]|nr:DUF5117 domain-containing protein [Duncaniella sp.]
MLLGIILPEGVSAKKKKVAALPKIELKGAAKDSADFMKNLKDARVCKGMFNTYFDKKNKLWFELPDSVFDHTYLLVNRVNSLSTTKDYVAGQMACNPMLIKFTRDDNNVYLHLIQTASEVAADDPIRVSFDRNFVDPVLKGFKIANKNKDGVFIDVTSFFGGNEKIISPIKESNHLIKIYLL